MNDEAAVGHTKLEDAESFSDASDVEDHEEDDGGGAVSCEGDDMDRTDKVSFPHSALSRRHLAHVWPDDPSHPVPEILPGEGGQQTNTNTLTLKVLDDELYLHARIIRTRKPP